jgi:cytochrome oxidase Cu insertion factor (SCO1/SenC/PrrC family)
MDRIRFFRAAVAATAALSLLLVLSLGLSACGSGASTSGSTASGATTGAKQDEDKDLAPNFSGPTLGGQQVSLEQYRGKPLIVVFMGYT